MSLIAMDVNRVMLPSSGLPIWARAEDAQQRRGKGPWRHISDPAYAVLSISVSSSVLMSTTSMLLLGIGRQEGHYDGGSGEVQEW